MDIAALEQYVLEIGLFDQVTITLIGSGESNVSYLAISGDQKAVIRTARDDTPNEPRFENEHHFMKFVEFLDLPFAPRSLHYNPDLQIHIISFAEGTDASVIDLDKQQTELFVTQLKQLETVDYKTYLEWCHANNLTPHKVESYTERSKTYIDNRIEYIKNSDKDAFASQAYAWITEKVSHLATKLHDINTKETFFHGDLRWNKGGGNLRVDGDTITFIDWELTRFISGGLPEVSDILGSIPINDQNKQKMRQLLNSYTAGETDINSLLDDIEYGMLWSKMGNVIWAVERYCFLASNNAEDQLRYKELATGFMRDGDTYFNTPFEQWF